MPIVTSTYNPPFPFRNGHLSTIYSGIIRKVKGLVQERERLELSDGDFMDLDWSHAISPTSKVVILLHGLEGNAQRPYITGAAKYFTKQGIDACAVNFRGCSGSTNRLFRSYHSGATEDLEQVVDHILQKEKYDQVFLNGFSLGGNMALKYLGEGRSLPKEIKAAIVISAPCQLHSSLEQLLKPKNMLYANRFKARLVEKLRAKKILFPNKLSDGEIARINTLKDFDDIYTSRAHGFLDAMDYYKKSSSLQFLKTINIPTLIINAQNDSFLGDLCFPHKEAQANNFLYFESPNYGGHVGFYDRNNITYTEKRALNFIEEQQ
ncbi:2-succinyl-6-hydroxy-2,4-cyclohexadiene-1-carboxylate synthase [Arenibacter antarcticus]|uniref:YheT family hydrolase n=1 Tax=Arenibacter antarcticus TaxID=2040469 RepID=A0ABW5VIC3_9FLAO|nr:alpha/beta fold hydrolase [Arenibacter sp. H213]MCM4166696.1 alpha/beta hydrolase [Arenibacter sp. H213]